MMTLLARLTLNPPPVILLKRNQKKLLPSVTKAYALDPTPRTVLSLSMSMIPQALSVPLKVTTAGPVAPRAASRALQVDTCVGLALPPPIGREFSSIPSLMMSSTNQ